MSKILEWFHKRREMKDYQVWLVLRQQENILKSLQLNNQMTEERLKEIRRRKKERYGKAYSV